MPGSQTKNLKIEDDHDMLNRETPRSHLYHAIIAAARLHCRHTAIFIIIEGSETVFNGF